MSKADEGDRVRRQATEPHAARASALPEYRSEDLLKTARQVAIMHRGQRYILRETRTGKLILYK